MIDDQSLIKNETASQTLEEAKDETSDEAKLRNEAIFKNLTFDQHGNPLHQHPVTPEKLISQVTIPRFKILKRRNVVN